MQCLSTPLVALYRGHQATPYVQDAVNQAGLYEIMGKSRENRVFSMLGSPSKIESDTKSQS